MPGLACACLLPQGGMLPHGLITSPGFHDVSVMAPAVAASTACEPRSAYRENRRRAVPCVGKTGDHTVDALQLVDERVAHVRDHQRHLRLPPSVEGRVVLRRRRRRRRALRKRLPARLQSPTPGSAAAGRCMGCSRGAPLAICAALLLPHAFLQPCMPLPACCCVLA